MTNGENYCLALIGTAITDEIIAPIINVTRIGELTANFVASSPIIITLMMEEILTSQICIPTRATWHNIPGDGILHSHNRGNLKFYIALTSWAL
jgi:hypothetical protein